MHCERVSINPSNNYIGLRSLSTLSLKCSVYFTITVNFDVSHCNYDEDIKVYVEIIVNNSLSSIFYIVL